MSGTAADFRWGVELPTLVAPGVVLRQLAASDVPNLFAIFSDAEVLRYWDGPLMTSPADAAAYLAQIDQLFRRRELYQWGIAERASDEVIGTCTLCNVSMRHRRAEIGFALGRAHWGRRRGTEAVSRLLAFAFEELALYRIEADADPRNDRSLRLLERLGFRREGLLRGRYQVNGEAQDAVMLGLLVTDWRASGSAAPSPSRPRC